MRLCQMWHSIELVAEVKDKVPVQHGSGNVFADLGLPDAEERLAKAALAVRIGEAIQSLRLTQAQAARRLGVDQHKISRLLRGQLSGFSTECLLHFLTLLGRDIEIVISHAPPSRHVGRVHVAGA